MTVNDLKLTLRNYKKLLEKAAQIVENEFIVTEITLENNNKICIKGYNCVNTNTVSKYIPIDWFLMNKRQLAKAKQQQKIKNSLYDYRNGIEKRSAELDRLKEQYDIPHIIKEYV